MRILPIINVLNRPLTLRNNTSPISCVQNSMPFDTVSFSANKNGVFKDGGIDEKNMNTDAIIAHLEECKIEDAINFINELEDSEWDPNFCVSDESGEPRCLLGLVISLMKDVDKESVYYDKFQELADKIVEHPEFEVINRTYGEDNLYSAIVADCPQVAIGIMTTDDFHNKTDMLNFDRYISAALENDDMSVVHSTLTNLRDSYANLGMVKVSEDDKEINKIKSNLKKYEVIIGENDPKSLSEVGGMFKAKKDIDEFIIKPWNKDFRDRIIENKLNRPSGFLMSGPPGCGKTYIMKAIASETGYPLYEVNLSNVGTSEGYATQKLLKNLFDDLEKIYKKAGEPSIVILDELDSIAMNRGKCQTDWKKDDINALLMVLNNSAQRGIIVIGATNAPEALDDAVKRPGRLDKHIEIGLPNSEETKDIIEKVYSSRPIASELLNEHLDEMTEKLKGMSPAKISSILHSACLNAIYEYKDFATMEDFDKVYDNLKNQKTSSGRVKIKGFGQE